MQNDLRLLALALIAQAPRHGYDLIKRIEELTEGWYAPSPGVVYPTLTFLDEAGYVTAEPEGNKKLYTITEAGQAHLAENQALADAILSRLAGIGARASRFRGERETRGRERNEPQLPRGVDAALLNLRDVLVRRLASDPAAATDLVELLVKAAREAEQR
ncbi:PadR family transcriptional regulator [Rhizobium sp. YIM 134829]|uniref:PadR family transcriptional regulator n=1 Tax=Rhizobium sp. YIM 134829 TaxID=3390453 RepID=UPI00397A4B40